MMMTRKNIPSTSAETRNLETNESPRRTDCCESCRASLRPVRLSIGDMAVNAACCILLLTVLTLAGYIADKLLERNGLDLFDQPVWHEPLDSWSL